MDNSGKPQRVRLDLAKLATNLLMLPGAVLVTPDDIADQLRRRGWTEADGWWTPPDEGELQRYGYGVTARE